MPTPKKPTDHLPAKGGPFRFTAGGRTHVLPNISVGLDTLTGRDLRDASLNGEAGQIAYLIKALEAGKPRKASLDALYDLPQGDMVEVLNDWAEHGDGDGASLGESPGSSS